MYLKNWIYFEKPLCIWIQKIWKIIEIFLLKVPYVKINKKSIGILSLESYQSSLQKAINYNPSLIIVSLLNTVPKYKFNCKVDPVL